jgi:hypothetical protein
MHEALFDDFPAISALAVDNLDHFGEQFCDYLLTPRASGYWWVGCVQTPLDRWCLNVLRANGLYLISHLFTVFTGLNNTIIKFIRIHIIASLLERLQVASNVGRTKMFVQPEPRVHRRRKDPKIPLAHQTRQTIAGRGVSGWEATRGTHGRACQRHGLGKPDGIVIFIHIVSFHFEPAGLCFKKYL